MPGDHDYKKKKKELKEKLAKIGTDNKRGDVDVDKNEQYKSVESNEYYNKHDADMGGYNKNILDKVQLKNKKKVKKAELTDVTKEQKKKNGKEKLVHKAKGVATNYNNPSKVKKRKLKGKVSKLKTRLAGLAYSDKKKNKFPIPKDKAGKPLWNEDNDGNPITKEDRMKRYKHMGTVHYDAAGERVTKKEYESGAPRITDKDVATQLKRTAQEHEHSIHFKGYKGEYYKRASLVSAEGRYAKYWLLNAKQTNGNGWGVSQQSIAKNIHKFVGKPLVVTAKSWVPDSVYGDAYEHPYLPTNDINKVLDHQEKYRVGSIVDIIEKDGDYFANIEINQKFAHMILPPFCSPAIFQNNPAEPEGQISDWEALHLAALHEDPAYGSRIALLRGTCVGTQDQCTVQFKSAKQEAKIVCTKDLKGRLATLKKNNNLKQRIGALTPNWNEILTKNTTRPIIKGGMDYRAGFVSEAGDYYEAYPEHEPFLKDIITKHGDKKLINTYMPKGKKLYEGDIYNKWMKDTGMIRTRFDSFSPAIHTETDPTDAQRKTIGKFLKDSNIDKQDIVFEYGQDNFTGVEDMFDYDDPASSSGHDSIRDRIRSRHSKLKQRIAAVSPTVMNQKDGETIANAYDKMLHDPNNPVVKESYSAFIKETEDQFNELKKNGLRIDPIKPGTNPYQTADDLHNDLKKNNHIYYYPSEEGFGSTDNKFGDHPLLKESNVTYKGKKLLNNDVFRIVHDINGHNLANSDFSPEGEHNAFLSHRKMYSPLAGKALFTETAAQANWGSYNKKSGASNRKLMEQGRVNELVFADQKAGLLPDDIINTEWHTGTSRTGKLKQRLALEGGVGGVRKYWLYPDGKISEDVRWHDKLHFNDEGQMRDKGGVKITNEQGKYDNYFGVALRQHLTPAQKSHIKQELKDYGFYRNKGNVTFDHGDNKNNTVDSTTKDFGDGFAHSYEHNQKPIGSQKISKLKQRLGVIGMPEPFEDRYETVKNTKSNLSSFKIEDPEMDYILGKTDKIRPKKQGLDRLVKNRWAKQKTASSYSMPGWYTYGPDMDAIKAFQKKQEYQSGKGVVNRKTGLKRSDWKFRTDGKSLFLHDHEIAKHVKGGIQVSNAGYDTPLTYATLNALGINAKGTKYDPEGGLAELGSKKIDHRSKEWVFIPQDEIQSGPIVYSDRRGKGKQTGRTNEEQSIFRKKAVNKELNEQGRRGLPLSKTNIQPEDQKVIDKATGIKSKKPYETLATEAHHVLSYKDNPGLRSNEGNSIMLPADYHKFISNYEKSSPTKNLNRLKQMHSKLDRLIKGKQRKAGMSKKVAQIVNSFKQSGFDPTGISGIWDAQNSKNLNAYEKPDLERIWELYGRRGMGFNSITNTIEGPNNDIGLIAKQLTEIEEEGGIPALGFDNGSLEAVNVTYGTKDEVLDKLLPHQNSTGYIDEDGKLDIPDNPRYEDYLKEIERKMD